MAPDGDEKDHKPISFGQFRGRSFLDVYQNEKHYVNWCMNQQNTNNRKLKEFVSYIQRKAAPRFGLMATECGESENDLIAILDLGCNRTCHGDRRLQRYMHAVDQRHYPLQPDHRAGFRGIGGSINTKGIRNLDVLFEIEDGMAVGEIDTAKFVWSFELLTNFLAKGLFRVAKL